jgi:hypothetical protein
MAFKAKSNTSGKAQAPKAPAAVPVSIPLEKRLLESVIPLGTRECGTKHVFWSVPLDDLVEASTTALSQNPQLMVWMGQDWLWKNCLRFNEKSGVSSIDYVEARSVFLTQSVKAGEWNENVKVDPGVWEHGDEVVVNGRKVWSDTGKELKRVMPGRVYVKPAITDTAFDDVFSSGKATDEDAKKILDALSLFAWENKSYSKLAFGWLALSYITGALKWNPHFYLAAQPGSGKTTIQRFILELCPPALRASESEPLFDYSQTTPAGLRIKIKGAPRAIFVDEFETTASRPDKDETFNAMLRAASSHTTATKGTSDQTGIEYKLRFMVMAAGVAPPSMDAALAQRVLVCRLKSQALAMLDRKGAPAALPSWMDYKRVDFEKTKQYGKKLFVRMLGLYSKFKKNLDTVREVLECSGDSSRFQDTIGPVIAGYLTLLHGREVSYSEVKAEIAALDLTEQRDASGLSPAQMCLDWMLDSYVRVDGVDRLVRDLIVTSSKALRHSNGRGESCPSRDALALVGIHVENHKPGEPLAIWIHVNPQPGMKRLFEGSHWPNGSFVHALRGLPGVASVTRSMGQPGAKKAGKALFIPIGEVLGANPADAFDLNVVDEAKTLAATASFAKEVIARAKQ